MNGYDEFALSLLIVLLDGFRSVVAIHSFKHSLFPLRHLADLSFIHSFNSPPSSDRY